MGLSEHITRAQHHGLLGKQSTPDHWGRSEPPGRSPGSQARCRALSSEESRASVILLTNPDHERCCPISRGRRPRPGSVSWRPLHMWSCRTSQPAAANRWETLENMHRKRASKDDLIADCKRSLMTHKKRQ